MKTNENIVERLHVAIATETPDAEAERIANAAPGMLRTLELIKASLDGQKSAAAITIITWIDDGLEGMKK